MLFSEKLKLLRKKNNLTQAEFANSIGISRANLSGLELGKVTPTLVLINCISLMYHVDKDWLLDDNNSDLSYLNDSGSLLNMIMDKYEKLDDDYKRFVENQINQLLELQSKNQ